MHQQRMVLICLLSTFSVQGCSQAHTSGPSDAGPTSRDIGPFIADEGPVVYPDVCVDQECEGVGEACNGGVCWESRFAGMDTTSVVAPQCSLSANNGAAIVTWNGEPCAIADHGPGGTQLGSAVPIELCLALQDSGNPVSQEYRDLFPEGCIWSDGLPVTDRAPETPCEGFEPAIVTGVEFYHRGFCGGTCGTGGCPALVRSSVCVGRSDERSFGACASSSRRCRASDVGMDDSCLGAPIDGYGEPCLCMVTYPQNPDETELVGWQVAQSVCERYRDIFPASVECRGASFELIE